MGFEKLVQGDLAEPAPPIHFPYLVLVPHNIFVDSLSEKFSVLKALELELELERKTRS